MNSQPLFSLITLQEASDFIMSLPPKTQEKILFNIRKVRFGVKDSTLFKKLENTEIWEFRTLYNRSAYRLFAFWDKEDETLVVATHGLIKTTQKTPQADIDKAERMRKQWFANKHQSH